MQAGLQATIETELSDMCSVSRPCQSADKAQALALLWANSSNFVLQYSGPLFDTKYPDQVPGLQ